MFRASLIALGIAIPKTIREALNIEKNDYVEVIVRKIKIDPEKSIIKVLKQGYLVARVGAKGLIFLPADLKRDFDLHEKDIIEVLLLGYHKFDELVSEKGKKLLSKVQTSGKWIEIKQDELIPEDKVMKHFTYVFV
jgi:AbrB family looped-hinge helix DNA binding protein